MIAQLREKAKELERREVQVFIVEPNDSYRLRYLERRAGEGTGRLQRPIDEYTQGAGLWLGGDFPWPVVTDPGSLAGASYGVAFQSSLDSGEPCSRPDTFVIDRDGILRLVHRYRSTDFVAVDEITQLLDDLDEKRRLAGGLSKTGTDLALAFGDPDVELRAGAAAAVYWNPTEAFVPALEKGLGDASPRVRRLSAEALGRIGPAARAAAPALLGAILEVDRETRSRCDRALRVPRPAIQAVHLAVAEELRVLAEGFRVRGAATEALVALGSEAIPCLLAALEDRRAEVRLIAAEILARFTAAGESVAPALARSVTSDPEAVVREASIRSLDALGRHDRALVTALRDPDAHVRIAATVAIERTGGCSEWEAVVALVDTLGDMDSRVRKAACYALTHRSDESIPTVSARLEDPDPEVRARAARALERIEACGAD